MHHRKSRKTIEFRIRRALPADAPRIIAAIDAVCAEREYNYTAHYVPTPQWEVALHRPQEAPNYLLLIAEYHGVLLGVAHLFPLCKSGADTYTAELGILVLASFRGCGVGTAMMQELLHQAPALGYGRIILSVRRANERAIRLYRKFGFGVEGLQWREYAFLGQQEELLMARVLNPAGFGGNV